ncbi:MAG: VWA domain-containing protein [Nitrospinae bacterium]|nr:VWA domain-containing protein [Nitrospinota bacterium]
MATREMAAELERLIETAGNAYAEELLKRVLLFGQYLKAFGFGVTPGRMLDLHRSLTYMDITRREDFYHAARTNLVSHHEELALFEEAFKNFWEPDNPVPTDPCGLEEPPPLPEESRIDDLTLGETEEGFEELPTEQWQPGNTQDLLTDSREPGWTDKEILTTKDFGQCDERELLLIRRVIAKLAPKLASQLSRRKKSHRRGHLVDHRRTFRSNLKYGGEMVELARKTRRVRKTRLVLLCDVSGSMDYYSRFLIYFLYGLSQELKGVETLVFSTRLTRITDLLRRKGLEHGLQAIAKRVMDWSGGTKIGACLQTFNTYLADKMLTRKSVLIIMSDGWDRGDVQLLEREMRLLRHKAYRIIWLNPLLGSPHYQPLCQGIKAVLPHCDYFLPVHNLESLMGLAKMLHPLWR